MKKLIKYLSIIIVVIAISAAVYVSTSTNQTVEMQNKEALAEKDPTVIDLNDYCEEANSGCGIVFHLGDEYWHVIYGGYTEIE
ncbi:MAG: hypothetical protein U9Q83_01040 [Bacteroidota bacterium]|nr:hypothetical protein [Bacteroidota bacterium]